MYQEKQKEKRVVDGHEHGGFQTHKEEKALSSKVSTFARKKKSERLFKRLSTNSRMGQMERAKLCRGTMTLVIKRVKDASEASNQIWSADWPKEITSSLCVTELNKLGDAEAHPSNVAISRGSTETGSHIFTHTLTHTSGAWRRRPTHSSVTTN